MKVKLEKTKGCSGMVWEKLETVKLQKKYVTDSIGTAWKLWSHRRAIILKCQTGEGKTTFVEDVIVKDAIAKGKKILIVSNRLSQSVANKKRLLDMYQIKNVWSDEGLRIQSYFGPHIVIVTYQKLFHMIQSIDAKDFEYAVFDEMHYFTSDATFSAITGALLKQIPNKFRESKRIYISATPEEVIPFIVKAETNKYATAGYKIHHILRGPCCNVSAPDDVNQREAVVREMTYATNEPLPIMYYSNENYKYLKVQFFEDFEVIKQKIISSNEKWIVFVTSKEFGQELSKSLEDCIYVDAETKEEDSNKFLDLIEKETFDAKVLVCTSVFINGNNIKDSNVKNIVIFHTNICDIKQAIGRKRVFDKKKEVVNVFLHIPEISTLTCRINRNLMILEKHAVSLDAPKDFSNMILHDEEVRKMVKKMIYPQENGSYAFNYLTVEKLNNDIFYMDKIKNMIAKDKALYVKHIAKEFSLPYRKSMCKLLVDGRAVIETKLDEFVKMSPVSKEAFKKISQEITALRREFKFISDSDNFGENRPPLDCNAFNARLKEFSFKFKVIKSGEDYFCLKL